MIDAIIQHVGQLPPEWATFLLAAVPIGELRAALPVGVNVFGLPIWEAFFISYLGNLLPIAIVFAVLPPIFQFVERRIPAIHRFMERYFYRLERKYGDRYERYGSLFLIILVAIPLPTSGAWTASILAVLFDIDARYSIPAMMVGLLIAGGIVSWLTFGFQLSLS